jgi:hypothetical protein
MTMAVVTITLEDFDKTEPGWLPVAIGIKYEPGMPLVKKRQTHAQKIGHAIMIEAVRLKSPERKKRKT